ncbi:MAG: prolipoprotein diacylglyceryl transferase [Elusimicrobia bacterium CG_4_10_14_0_2_um_filter_56_8]|nr:MAG: prolipoprotein diacylglyceryl transferase [Elusimicrobia bacterium CG1_02_56_21]PJA12759.1 MAG: prolipoprotein diacylglyceryl transferase [Elusimicrobia bacterium CG_4_10_14_0_2_um_filter_56_8]
MHPIIFQLGSFKLPAYGLMVATGYLAAILYIFRKAGSAGFKKETLSDIIFYAVLSGMLGAKFFYAATYWNEFGADFQSKILYLLKSFQYGFVFYGGLIFGSAAFFIKARLSGLSPLKAADLVAPALALGHAFGRIGCFLAGCCHGRPTSCPVSVIFTNPASEVNPAYLGVPLHPAQLYEAAGNLAIFFLLNAALKRSLSGKLRAGAVLALYAALYSALRFFMEFLRGDDRGLLHLGLSPAQLISAAVFAAAASVFLRIKYEKK